MGGDYPLVSIVTPSFNQGRFIEETIKSVLAQDYPRIEYFVVDGGSTDNTLDILRSYTGKIKWVSEQDNGQSDAIDKGFRMSSGEILAWLNSDDVYLPGAVRKAVSFLKENSEAALVYGRSFYMDESGKITGEYPAGGFDLKRLPVFNFICQPSAFFTRTAYFGVGGVDKSLSYVMDYDLWIRIARKYEVRFLSEPLSKYRLHGESKTVSALHAFKNNREVLEAVLRHFDWAPANRVFAYAHSLLKSKFPFLMKSPRLLTVPVTALTAFFMYVRLNRGFKGEDINALKLSNLRRLFRGWNGFTS